MLRLLNLSFTGTRGWGLKSWKYRLIDLFGRRPGWCWTELVCWVEYGSTPLGDARSVERCHRSALECGSCYCGKFRRG